jgi:hypothetical protein
MGTLWVPTKFWNRQDHRTPSPFFPKAPKCRPRKRGVWSISSPLSRMDQRLRSVWQVFDVSHSHRDLWSVNRWPDFSPAASELTLLSVWIGIFSSFATKTGVILLVNARGWRDIQE